MEDLRISQATAGILRRAPFCVLEKSGEAVVEFSLNEGRRPLFVNDAGGKCFVGFSERFEAPEDIRIGRGLPLGAEFSDGNATAERSWPFACTTSDASRTSSSGVSGESVRGC